MGGPEKVVFEKLTDWSTNENDSIKYYSGIGIYCQTFDMKKTSDKQFYLDLGEVNVMAKVWHLMGKRSEQPGHIRGNLILVSILSQEKIN